MNTTLKKFLFFFAASGWLLSLIIHICSLAKIDLTDYIPTGVIHLGVFLVWIPVVLYLRKNGELQQLNGQGFLKNMNPLPFFNTLFKNAPNWVRIIAISCFFYGILNIFFVWQADKHIPNIKFNTARLTEQDYINYKANQIRGFSGYWIVFYSTATAILFPFSKRNTKVFEQKPGNHIV